MKSLLHKLSYKFKRSSSPRSFTSCWSWLGSWSVSAFRCRPTKGSRVLQITNHCWTGTYFSKNSIRMHDESHLFLIEKKKNVLKYDLKLLNNNDFCLIYMKHNLITVKQKHLGHSTALIANNRTIGIISFSHQIQCYFFFITRRCFRGTWSKINHVSLISCYLSFY